MSQMCRNEKVTENLLNTVSQWNSNIFNSFQKLNNNTDMTVMCGGKEIHVG